MSSFDADRFVTMKDGTVLPVPVLRRLWDIEAAGVHFQLDGGDVVAGPRRLLDDSDLAFVRTNKALIISILSMDVRM
jgi:hypothetical protein